MGVQAAEISAILKEQIKNFGQEAEMAEVGRVLSGGDGIARVYGLGIARDLKLDLPHLHVIVEEVPDGLAIEFHSGASVPPLGCGKFQQKTSRQTWVRNPQRVPECMRYLSECTNFLKRQAKSYSNPEGLPSATQLHAHNPQVAAGLRWALGSWWSWWSACPRTKRHVRTILTGCKAARTSTSQDPTSP